MGEIWWVTILAGLLTGIFTNQPDQQVYYWDGIVVFIAYIIAVHPKNWSNMKQPHTVSCWKGGNSRPHLFHLKKPALITKTTARGKKTIIYNNYNNYIYIIIHIQHAFRRRAFLQRTLCVIVRLREARHSCRQNPQLIDTYWHILTRIDTYWHILTHIDITHTLPWSRWATKSAGRAARSTGPCGCRARWPIIWEAATPTAAQWIQRTSPILVREVIRDGRRHASTGDRAVKSQGVETPVEQWTPLEPLVELPFEKKSHYSICFVGGFEAVIPFFLGNGTKLDSSGNLMKPSPQKKSPWNPATIAPGDVIAGDVELEFVAIVPMIRQYLCLHLIVVLHPSHLGWKMLRSSTPRSEVPRRRSSRRCRGAQGRGWATDSWSNWTWWICDFFVHELRQAHGVSSKMGFEGPHMNFVNVQHRPSHEKKKTPSP